MFVTQENFQQVLEGSMQKPLLCFFYLDDGSCERAKTAVTAAVSDTNEYVTLGLCNLDEPVLQSLAGHIGLRGVPALVAVDQGNPVAILEGEDQIIEKLQELLNEFMPSEGDLKMREALQAEAAGDLSAAVKAAEEAYKLDETNRSFKFIYARMLIAAKNTAKAHELLDNAGREEKAEPEYQQLIAALTLAEQAQNSPALLELQSKFESDPSDENAVAYAIALSDAGKKEEALEMLFNKLKEDLNKEEVKKTFLDILNTMNGDKSQSRYRRKLYTLMY